MTIAGRWAWEESERRPIFLQSRTAVYACRQLPKVTIPPLPKPSLQRTMAEVSCARWVSLHSEQARPKGAAEFGENSAAPVQSGWEAMWRALYIAVGFWLARFLFRRRAQVIDPLARLRNAGW